MARKTQAPAASRYDVVIAGGGPAGLSAAMILGRCRFRVVVVDAGRPRNRVVRAMHGFLGRDGAAPLELIRLGRREVARYGVELLAGEVRDAVRSDDGGFNVTLAGGRRLHGRRLLLATGVEDPLPAVPGLAELYGISVFHCPLCDGWEVRDRPLALYGRGGAAARFALRLSRWSADLVLLTDGPTRLSRHQRTTLERAGVVVRSERVAALEARRGRLARVRFANGEALPRHTLFFGTRPRQASDLAARLGVRFTSKGMVQANRQEETGVPGLYVAGDASRDVQLAVIAAAEGTKAGVAIHADLEKEGLLAPGR